jgi:segregation and condensation protein B
MADRVLNFSEFADKYSDDEELDVNDVTSASSNFEEGFDDESYDSPEIKPNRPVAGAEGSIPSPDEDGAPSFTSDVDSEMVAPRDEPEEEDNQEVDDSESEVEGSPIPPVDFDEDGGNPEDEDDEDEEEDEDDEDEDEDEEDDNQDKDTNESLSIGMLESFNSFIRASN